MIPANETFGGTFPFKPNFFNGNGFKMHYVDEGEGEVIIYIATLFQHFLKHIELLYPTTKVMAKVKHQKMGNILSKIM